MEKDDLSATINTIFSITGLKHTLHLYTPTVNKYTIQSSFLGIATTDEQVIYVTNEKTEVVLQELKGLNTDFSIVKPEDIKKINTEKKLRIVVDASSINTDEYLKIENYLNNIGKEHFVLCTYDVSKLEPNMVKELVICHEKLMLTTSNLTVLSSEAFEDISEDSIERFVKNELENIVLSLILKEPMCGTDIIKTIHKNFNVLLSPGTIYPLLHSLEKKGLLKCEYEVRTKTYKPVKEAEQKIRTLLNEQVQANRLLSKFLQSAVLKESV